MVYQVVEGKKGGNEYACKIMMKEKLQKGTLFKDLNNEIAVQKRLDHPNIVKLIDHFQDDMNVFINMFYCTNGTLKDVVHNRGKLTELEAKYYIRQIVKGLIYLKENEIIHRDVSLENIMLDDKMQVKIGDFSIVAKLRDRFQRRRSLVGKPHYLSPEILEENRWDGYSFEVDIWALGVCLFRMLVGKMPYDSEDQNAIYQRIQIGLYTIP